MARPLPRISARKVEAVLRDPRRTLEGAVEQLLSLARRSTAPDPEPADPDRRTYRIDDLAQLTGVTVRNIRAYQERGLLMAPERRGRVALFDDAHVSRLKIITSMLDRGYAIAHISEMLTAWEAGQDLADVLGLEGALIAAHSGVEPVTMSTDDARELAGGEVELAVLADAGLITPAGENARVLRPDLLQAIAELRGFGIGAKDMVRLHRDVTVQVDAITRRLVDEAVAQVGHRFLGETPPDSEEIGELVVMLHRFRVLALGAVTSTLELSLERTVEELLGSYLAEVLRKNDAV